MDIGAGDVRRSGDMIKEDLKKLNSLQRTPERERERELNEAGESVWLIHHQRD